MDLRSLTVGRAKPPAHIATIDLGDGQPFQMGFRAPTLADMAGAEKQGGNIEKGVFLLMALAVDPLTNKAVYGPGDKDGLMSLEPHVFQALTEGMSPVLSTKKPAPSANGTAPAPSSAV